MPAPGLAGLAIRAVQSVHALRQTQINTYATYSRITLYIYDILLNLSREQQLVWSDPLRPSSLLYYFVRYPVIAKQIFFLRCDAWNRFTFIVSIVLTRIAIVISFILRVYAVTDRGVFLVSVLSILGLLSTALDVVQVKELSCTQKSNPLAFVLTFISLIVFDVIATIIVVWKMAGVVKIQGGLRKLGSESVIGLIVRSGALYFMVITGIQLGAVILYFLPQGLYSTVLNDYTLIISSILISRFLLDLRSISVNPNGADPTFRSTNLPSLRFAHREQSHGDYGSKGTTFFSDFEDPPASFSIRSTRGGTEESI